MTAGDPWAGRHIGVRLLSTVGFDLMGGYWDLDNIRLTATGGPALAGVAKTSRAGKSREQLKQIQRELGRERQKVKEAAAYSKLKVKVGTPRDEEVLRIAMHDIAGSMDDAARMHAALGYPAYNVRSRLDSLSEYSAMNPKRLSLLDADGWRHWPLARSQKS